MKTMMFAVAMAIALPGAAFAQAATAPAQNAMGGMHGMKMDGINMQTMGCKDMQAMTAKDHSMSMSKAEIDKMCPEAVKAAPEAGATDAHQGHSGH